MLTFHPFFTHHIKSIRNHKQWTSTFSQGGVSGTGFNLITYRNQTTTPQKRTKNMKQQFSRH